MRPSAHPNPLARASAIVTCLVLAFCAYTAVRMLDNAASIVRVTGGAFASALR